MKIDRSHRCCRHHGMWMGGKGEGLESLNFSTLPCRSFLPLSHNIVVYLEYWKSNSIIQNIGSTHANVDSFSVDVIVRERERAKKKVEWMPWIKYISQPAIADISFDKHSTLGLAFPLIHITFLHRLVSHHDQDSKLNLNANPVKEQEKKKKEGITDWHKNGENKTSYRVGREERIKSWGKFDQILMKVIHSNIVSHSSFIDSVIDFESRIRGGFLEWSGRILKIPFHTEESSNIKFYLILQLSSQQPIETANEDVSTTINRDNRHHQTRYHARKREECGGEKRDFCNTKK